MKIHEMLYAIPTEQAIEKLQDFVDKIVTPPLAIEFFRKEVESVQISFSVLDLLAKFKETHYSSMPVYDGTKFLGVITERGLWRWMSEQLLQGNFVKLQSLKVRELPIYTTKNDYVFVSANINIYEADEIFTKRRKG
ncbi:CBS domain-containing protein [bacterium]|nr:CBS domain-containing protein [bacterium]